MARNYTMTLVIKKGKAVGMNCISHPLPLPKTCPVKATR